MTQFTALLPQLSHPGILAVPDRLAPSAWLGHVPFAFWLIRVHRPRVTVELGVDKGVSLFAMMQSAAMSGEPGKFFGVDHWRGDAQAGQHLADVYWEVMAFNEALPNRASLMPMDFDTAALHFEDKSVDLLHIDGFHSYEAVRHDFETWLPKLGPRGVVLFHDINERTEGFGVWRFWDELRVERPSFTFLHAHGLGVLYVGSDSIPDWMQALASITSTDEGDAVRSWFEWLGVGVAVRQKLTVTTLEHQAALTTAAAAAKQIEDIRARLNAMERALGKADQVVAMLKDRLSSQAEECVNYRSSASDLHDEFKLLRIENDRLRRELDKERAAHGELRTETIADLE